MRRNAIDVDINYEAAMVTPDRLNFIYKPFEKEPAILVYRGGTRNPDLIENESIDFIATHPLYFNISPYFRRKKEDRR